MTEIVDGAIWLGSKEDAEDMDFLVRNKITHIMNVCGRLARPRMDDTVDMSRIKNIVYFEMEAADHPEYPILEKHGNMISKLMYNVFNENSNSRILIHCYAGINRSATLLINFLKEYMYPDDCIHTIIGSVRRLRPIILSNKGFESQLIRKFFV